MPAPIITAFTQARPADDDVAFFINCCELVLELLKDSSSAKFLPYNATITLKRQIKDYIQTMQASMREPRWSSKKTSMPSVKDQLRECQWRFEQSIRGWNTTARAVIVIQRKRVAAAHPGSTHPANSESTFSPHIGALVHADTSIPATLQHYPRSEGAGEHKIINTSTESLAFPFEGGNTVLEAFELLLVALELEVGGVLEEYSV